MTRTLSLRSVDIPSIHKFGVGFDHVLNEMLRMTDHQNSATYPFYNVVKVTENDFYIELAVAGFSDADIRIELDDRILSVSGSKEPPLDAVEYLYKGISDRSFIREFTLADHVEVSGAEMKHGMLTISLVRNLPQKPAPKTIDISVRK